MTIYRTTPTSNFTVISNELIDSTIPAKAKTVLLYLLSKPPAWNVKINDIKKRLGLSSYSARQALQWLADAGYVAYQRLKSGHTIWSVYDHPNPQTRVVMPRVENPQMGNQTDLVKTEAIIKTERLQAPEPIPTIEPDKNVVVSCQEERPPILLPDSIKPNQQLAARKLLSNVTKDQLTAIMLVFNTAIASKNIANPIGYLHQLVKAAQEGTLTAPSATQPTTIDQRIAKERQRRESEAKRAKVDNVSFFEMLAKEYGYQAPVTP